MKVEVWSDVACPFCYIGKRKFEAALKQFEYKDRVDLEFRSFELDPTAEKVTSQSMHEMLAAKYGMTIEKAKQMNAQVTAHAKEVGLDFQLDKIILTNTKDAHRLSHFAKEKGKMNEMMERILKAYFTEGLNVGDFETLSSLAKEIGLDEGEVRQALAEGKYNEDVERDEATARQIGVQGVPFFVFNRKYAVSGAQPVEQFLTVLNKALEEEG